MYVRACIYMLFTWGACVAVLQGLCATLTAGNLPDAAAAAAASSSFSQPQITLTGTGGPPQGPLAAAIEHREPVVQKILSPQELSGLRFSCDVAWACS